MEKRFVEGKMRSLREKHIDSLEAKNYRIDNLDGNYIWNDHHHVIAEIYQVTKKGKFWKDKKEKCAEVHFDCDSESVMVYLYSEEYDLSKEFVDYMKSFTEDWKNTFGKEKAVIIELDKKYIEQHGYPLGIPKSWPFKNSNDD